MILIWRNLLALLLMLLILCGCGGKGSTSVSKSTSEKILIDRATMKAATAELNRLYKEDPTNCFPKLASLLRSDPRVARVTEYDQMVVAIMAEGNMGVFMKPTRGEGGVGSFSREVRQGSVPVNGATTIMCSFNEPGRFTEYGRELEPLLSSGGYKAEKGVLRGTLADYLSLRGKKIGFLYADTHGFVIPKEFRKNDVDGEVESDESWYNYRHGFYLVCAPMLDSDLEGKRLVSEYQNSIPGYDPYRLFNGEPGETTWVSLLMYNPNTNAVEYLDTDAVGISFFKKRLKFDTGSVVFLNCCFGAQAADTMMNAGVGMFAGWTQPVQDQDANRAAKRFFELTAIRGAEMSQWQAAAEAVVSENLHLSQVVSFPKAELKFLAGSAAPERFLPKISSATLNNSTKEITMKGTFGSTKGVVYGNESYGVSLPVLRWSPTEVVVRAVGVVDSVFVVSSAGLLSNNFKLGGWLFAEFDRGPFECPGELEITITSADLQTRRLVYADPPGSGPGLRQPIAFDANPETNPNDYYLIVKIKGADKVDLFRGSVHGARGAFGLPHPPMYFGDTRTSEFRFPLAEAD